MLQVLVRQVDFPGSREDHVCLREQNSYEYTLVHPVYQGSEDGQNLNFEAGI